MDQEDKRKNQRIDSHNLLTYSCLDKNGAVITQGMGRTLDVSEGGILLETQAKLDPERGCNGLLWKSRLCSGKRRWKL